MLLKHDSFPFPFLIGGSSFYFISADPPPTFGPPPPPPLEGREREVTIRVLFSTLSFASFSEGKEREEGGGGINFVTVICSICRRRPLAALERGRVACYVQVDRVWARRMGIGDSTKKKKYFACLVVIPTQM